MEWLLPASWVASLHHSRRVGGAESSSEGLALARWACVGSLGLGMGHMGWQVGACGQKAILGPESREVCACADGAGFSRPILVAHSFGGFVAATTAAMFPDRFAGVIFVDSLMRPPGRAGFSAKNQK